MNMHVQIGWRNIWRNPKRTAVILTAIIIGVWSMIFLSGLMRGIADQMVRNGISNLTGHLQLHPHHYRRDPSVDHRISDAERLAAVLRQNLPAGAVWSRRVRVNAVAGNARHSSGVTLVGIDPAKEAQLSFVSSAITRGRYLRSGDNRGIIVGKALLAKYETRLGRKLVLMSQDATGEISSRAFRITGVFQTELKATEKQFVFVNLTAVQKMLQIDSAISEIAVLLPSHQQADAVAGQLRQALAEHKIDVSTWQDLLPLVKATIKIYDSFIFLWFLVVFIAMGFGIVNTTLMAVFERIREFGLLKALGMRPGWIMRMVLTESLFLLMLGLLAGNLLGMLSIYALAETGIDLSAFAAGLEFVGMGRIIFPVVQIRDVVGANLVVVVLGLAVSAYPAYKAAHFTPVQALTHT